MENYTDMSDLTIKAWSELIERVYVEDSLPRMLIPSLLLIIFIASLVGNSVTCIVIYCDRTMHTLTNYYLFNLAVSDFLVSLSIPLAVYEELHSKYIIVNIRVGDIACKIHYFLLMTLWNNCILTMTALAVERYMAICHPMMLQAMPVRRRVAKIIGIIWIVAIAEAIPDVWDVTLIRTKSAVMCFTTPTRLTKIVNGVLAVITFLIPLGIMTFVYSMIAFRINYAMGNAPNRRIFNKRNNRSKINKLIIALTVAFVVCWVPCFTIRICVATWEGERLMKVDKWWIYTLKVCSVNTWFSAFLNPLLFSVMSSKFRHSLKSLWNRKVRRQQTKFPDLYTSRPITYF